MRETTQIDHLERILRVVGQMRDEPERTLSLAEIGEIAALSPFHLIRVFRAITRFTPAAMQTAVRVQEAKRLLTIERSTVTDACFAVGFSSLGSFSQRFAYLTGVTPSDYRSSQERVDDLAEHLHLLPRIADDGIPAAHTVSGRLICDEAAPDAFYFVGLFPPGPPIGRPIVGDTLREAGDYVIRHVPDGEYKIYSAVIGVPRHTVDWVLPDSEEFTGGGHTVTMICGIPVRNVDIYLRRRTQVITPIMTTLMAIPDLLERARHNQRIYAGSLV